MGLSGESQVFETYAAECGTDSGWRLIPPTPLLSFPERSWTAV
jgi:hypothetical protein